MKLRKKYIIAAGLSIFLFSAVAYASSQDFLTQAQKYIDENCGKKLISNQTALLCYVFYKSQEQDQSINAINATLSPIPTQIQTLQNTAANQSNTIASLEAFLAPPREVDVFTTQQFTNGQQSDIIDTSNRRQIVIDGESEEGTGGFDLQYSDDKSAWTDEGGIVVGSEQWNQHVQKVFPVKGKYYKVIVNVYAPPFQGWSSLELY